MKITELLPKEICLYDYGNDKTDFTGVASHTARIKKGDLFVAIKGKSCAPLSLYKEIEERGALAVVTEWEEPMPALSIPCYYVKNARLAQSYIYYNYYRASLENIRFVAVTGTNGKTTTALMLAHLLSGKEKTGYIGTLGVYLDNTPLKEATHTTMTTPSAELLYASLALLASKGAKTVVLEVSSHAIAQERVAPLSFQAALFTNLSEEHLDFHKTMEEYFSVKARLVRAAAFSVINVDDAYGEKLAPLCQNPITVGVLQDASVCATDLYEKGRDGTQYTYQTEKLSFPVSLSLIGSFQVYNSLLAIAAALKLGVSVDSVKDRVSSFPSPKGRMEMLPLDKFKAPFSVIVDYAHTPDAFAVAIRAARKLTSGRLFVLFGAGGDREKEKRAQMGKIAEELSDFVYITRDNSRTENLAAIMKDIISGMSPTARRRVIANREKAIRTALSELQEGDTLLLLGKGHERYEWDSAGLHAFSEEDIVYDYLEKHTDTAV
ncbi:MAG: UDP-N-acetylmuramoyl-L-alanyl-D-glutamate--2,6-diaminopimelate ligase [Clostridia bacterium]|nr:UDP-N-acetylmuramoyl-L-alanyl-D-glutamate--2,6-diaminopimelate ligase [Clostridia bacterium]